MKKSVRSFLWLLAGTACLAIVPSVRRDWQQRTRILEEVLHDNARARLEQVEEIFAFELVYDQAKRSIDSIRFIDALTIAMAAATIGIIGMIYPEKTEHFDPLLLAWLCFALFFEALILLFTTPIREGPDPRQFLTYFVKQPKGARFRLRSELVDAAEENERIRAAKLVLFILSLGMTVGIGLVVAVHLGVHSKLP